jgi:hypothetical protein
MSTTLNRVLELVINGDLPGGANATLDSKTSGKTPSIRPRWMAGDACPLNLYFRKPATAIGAASTVYALSTPMSLVLSAKKDEQNIEGDELFRISDWAVIGSGETIYYQGSLDLTTVALASLFASGSDEVPVSVDIEYRDAANSSRLTWRAELTLCRQVYSGGIPPSSLSSSYLQSPDGSLYQITVDDAGEIQKTKIGLDQQGAGFVTLSYFNFVSPGGYVYRFEIDDNGELQRERIQ